MLPFFYTVSLIPAGVTEQSLVLGGGSRAGDMTAFVSASFTSGVDSLTLGASSSVGESGHKVGLESVYSGSGDNTSVLGSIHALTTASIMQLTDRRTDRLSIAPLALGGLVVGRVAIPHVVRWSRTIVNAYLLAEQVREQAEEAAKKVADESSSAATGMPPEDPEEGTDKDPKKSSAKDKLNDKLYEIEKAQSKADRIENLPDGRIRYYESERLARDPGPTRGNSRVVEYNPTTGQSRSWEESYSHAGEVIRVHPKTINGVQVDSTHYPLTGMELAELLK